MSTRRRRALFRPVLGLVAEVDTTALCDAVADIRVMSPALRCRSANPVLCGQALTVRCRDDFFGVIQAIEQSGPRDVLVVDGGGPETALAGESSTAGTATCGSSPPVDCRCTAGT